MAKRHRKKPGRSSSRVGVSTQLLIAGLVVLFILSGGATVAHQYLGFLDLSQWHVGQRGDLTGLVLGVFAIAVGLVVLVWRRFSSPSSHWAAKVLGIRSVADIYALSPDQFEQFVAFLFQHQGFDARVVGQTGDQGIDIELQRRGEHHANRCVAQCKRYQGSVGQPIVREFFGSFANTATEGYLVTTGTFTQPAREWAATRPLRLIDGTELMRWTEDVAHKLHHQNNPVPERIGQHV